MKQMNFRKELAKLTPRLRDNHPGKIYVFGIGEQWKGIHQWYIDVVNVDLTDYIFAFVDNDPAKQGTEYMGRRVIAPAEIDIENAVVLISSHKYSFDLTQQLQKIGLVLHNGFYKPNFFNIILRRFVYRQTSKFNKTQNGRCFVIGNGPSLRVEDLETLHKANKVTFAVNKIVNLFDKTIWRPTYYLIHDPFSFPEINILNQMKCPKFIGIGNASKALFDEYTYYYGLDSSPIYYDFPYRPKFSNNIELMYAGGCVTYCVIQAAASMGYSEIYLLGMDHEYNVNVFHDGTIINNDVECHFYEDKQCSSAAIDIMSVAFKYAREYCESHNIKICNATRGGALEIFERVNFDSLLES